MFKEYITIVADANEGDHVVIFLSQYKILHDHFILKMSYIVVFEKKEENFFLVKTIHYSSCFR